MKTVALVFPLVTVLLLGCDDSGKLTKDAPAADSGSAASAPVEYLKSAAKSQQKAVKTIDLTAINKAIESFYVQEGRFPKSLQELTDKSMYWFPCLDVSGKRPVRSECIMCESSLRSYMIAYTSCVIVLSGSCVGVSLLSLFSCRFLVERWFFLV